MRCQRLTITEYKESLNLVKTGSYNPAHFTLTHTSLHAISAWLYIHWVPGRGEARIIIDN